MKKNLGIIIVNLLLLSASANIVKDITDSASKLAKDLIDIPATIAKDLLDIPVEIVKGNAKLITDVETEVAKHLPPSLATPLDIVAHFGEILEGIYPGTRWCGAGNISTSSEEIGLGFLKGPDLCCKHHDNCEVSIPAQEKKYGIKNPGFFTRSACQCDREFYNCLKRDNSAIADELGVTYFDILGPKCLGYTHEAIGCAKSEKNRCDQYIFNTNSNKSMQWFDNPIY